MKQDEDSFRIYDSGFHIWLVNSEDQNREWTATPWLRKVSAMMKKRGWKVAPDLAYVGSTGLAFAKKYSRYGKRGDLEFFMSAGGRHMEIQFFQSIANQTNPNGGRYGSDHMGRMPYLLQKRAQVELRFLTEWALKQGLADHSDPRPVKAMDIIERDRTTSWHWPKDRAAWPGFIRHQTALNQIDRDGVAMNDGDERYFRDHHGILLRCRVYYNLNSVWWAVLSDTEVKSLGARELFQCEHPASSPKRMFRDLSARMDGHIRKAVASKDFLKAHHLQQASDRQCAANRVLETVSQ